MLNAGIVGNGGAVGNTCTGVVSNTRILCMMVVMWNNYIPGNSGILGSCR